MKHLSSLCVALMMLLEPSRAFLQGSNGLVPQRYSSELSAKQRGRGKLKRSRVEKSGDEVSLRTDINWCPMPPNQKLPSETGRVGLLDTELPTMKDSATNPTGAVAVVKAYNGQTYCFGSSCPSCKIPLTKAKVVEPPAPSDENADEDTSSPRIVCDFCKATYTLKDGSKVKSTESGGLFGGVVKSIFSSKDGGSLPMYKLGERNGKLVIAVD